ncbi:MAG: ecotin family protein [Desulfuromonadales bacterium]|jgi:ecotin|nr:ecotin family protein [Desulfuromonadales bacterium]
MLKKLALIMIGLTLFCLQAFAAEHPELKAFPAADEGMERFVIVLPDKDRGEEANFQVELIPGKVMLTDGVNQMRHGSAIEPRPLVGWGYTYYQVTGRDVAMSTMMAAAEGSSKIEQFVAGTPLLVRYNSRLPIVIYAPSGFDVRYRIWSAAATSGQAERR